MKLEFDLLIVIGSLLIVLGIILIIPGFVSVKCSPQNIKMSKFFFELVSTIGLLITLVMAISTFKQQKSDFEFRNRPNLQIINQEVGINVESIVRKVALETVDTVAARQEYSISLKILNHGSLPASIFDIRILVPENNSFGRFLPIINSDKFINVDIFPRLNIENISFNELGYKHTFEISDKISIAPFTTGEFKSGNAIHQFEFFAIELIYKTLGELNSNKEPYKYWVIYKRNDKNNDKNNNFIPYKSGIRESDLKEGWKKLPKLHLKNGLL